jgi:hypothetical protein
MSTNLDVFFGSIKKKRNEPALKLFNFVEQTIMQLAEVVQQLDEKLTGMESNLNRLQSDLEEVKRRPAASSPAPSLGGGGVSVPPPPGGGGGLPPLPGMGGGLSPTPPRSTGGSSPGGAPPADRPMNPMMVQANLQNELKAAFKNIRARLESGDE